MHWNEHVLFGLGTLSAGTAVAHGIGLTQDIAPEKAIAAVAAVLIGSIAPDIDHPKAFISHRIPKKLFQQFAYGFTLLLAFAGFGLYAGTNGRENFREVVTSDLFLFFAGAIVAALGLYLLGRFVSSFGHRKTTHTLFMALLVSGILAFVLWWQAPEWWWVGLFFGWGWLSHLLGDALTPSGIPMWWPVSKRPWHLVPYEWRGRTAVNVALLLSLLVMVSGIFWIFA